MLKQEQFRIIRDKLQTLSLEIDNIISDICFSDEASTDLINLLRCTSSMLSVESEIANTIKKIYDNIDE